MPAAAVRPMNKESHEVRGGGVGGARGTTCMCEAGKDGKGSEERR